VRYIAVSIKPFWCLYLDDDGTDTDKVISDKVASSLILVCLLARRHSLMPVYISDDRSRQVDCWPDATHLCQSISAMTISVKTLSVMTTSVMRQVDRRHSLVLRHTRLPQPAATEGLPYMTCECFYVTLRDIW
jgi:hypothetical protein